MNLEPKAKKRLAFLAAVLFLITAIAGSAYGLRRYAVHKELASLKAEGIAASAAGDHARAVEQLTRYLRRRADDPEALRFYARSRLAVSPVNDPQAAADVVQALQSVEQLSVLSSDERRSLMQLYGLVRNDSGVIHEADRLLSLSPNDPGTLKAKSLALVRQRDWPALAATRSWSQASPLDMEAESCHLSVMLQSGATPTEVVAQAVNLRRAHPDDARFELLESLVLTQTGLPAEPPESAQPGGSPDPRSAAEWARVAAARHQPDDMCARLLVDQLERSALFDESLGLLRRQIAATGDPVCRQALGRRLWVSEQWEDLGKLLHDTATSGTSAEGTSAEGTNAEGTSADGESTCLYGVAMSRLGRPDQAAMAVHQLEQRSNNPLANAWLSILNQLTGKAASDSGKLVTCYGSALAFDPENPLLNYFIADALARTGETDLAIEEFKLASARLATWAAPVARLSDLYLLQGRSEAALLAATQAQFREAHVGQGRDLSITVALGRAWLACLLAGRTNDEAGLAKLVAAVQQASPGEEQTLAIQVALLIRAKDRAAASNVLRQAMDSARPPSQSAVLNYAAISRGAGLDLEHECFDRCEREHGVTPDLEYARANDLLYSGNAEKGLKLLEAHNDRRPAVAGTEDDLAWKVLKARYLDASGNSAAAAAWVAIADNNPENLPLQVAALAARSTRSDRDFLDRTIERAHKLTSDGAVVWRLARARWLLDGPGGAGAGQKDVESATRILSAVIRTCPECIEARLLMASCQQKLQNSETAVEQLQAARDLLPDSSDVAMQLTRLLEERGDFTRAEQALRPFTDGPLADPVALVAAGWLQEHEGNMDAAEQSYRHALSLRPDLLAAQNNLAMILVRSGNGDNVQEALSLAGRAVKANPDSAPLLDTLAAAQAKNRDYDSALVNIAKAITLAGANPNFKLREVELLIAAGKKDAARRAFAQVEPILSNSSDKNKDWDLSDRLRGIRGTLGISSKPSDSTKPSN